MLVDLRNGLDWSGVRDLQYNTVQSVPDGSERHNVDGVN